MSEKRGPAMPPDVVDSWKEIASYLGRDVRTVLRWERTRKLPIHRLPGGPKPAVYALKSELDAWRGSSGMHSTDECHPVAPAGEPLKPDGQPAGSVAVLPFSSLSADKDNEYFSDGLADEIITALAGIPGLRVTARTSSFAFRGENRDVREIGSRLGVEMLLEGSVQRIAGRIRVSAQLVDCLDGCHIWCDHYVRDLTDVFSIQADIAASVAVGVRLSLASRCKVSALSDARTRRTRWVKVWDEAMLI